jgi:hypothetical protein
MDPIIPVSAKRTAQILALIAIVLTLLGWTTQYLAFRGLLGDFHPGQATGVARLFDLGGEANIATWYKALILLTCSVLLRVIYSDRKRQRNHFAGYWRDLGVVFLLLSIDEVATIHEGLGNRLSDVLETTGFFFFAWVIVGLAFVIPFSIIYLRFLWSLPLRPKYMFMLSGGVYVFSVLGLKMVEGWYLSTYGTMDMVYVSITAIKQFLEMASITTFIYALLTYIRHNVEAEIIRVYA